MCKKGFNSSHFFVGRILKFLVREVQTLIQKTRNFCLHIYLNRLRNILRAKTSRLFFELCLYPRVYNHQPKGDWKKTHIGKGRIVMMPNKNSPTLASTAFEKFMKNFQKSFALLWACASPTKWNRISQGKSSRHPTLGRQRAVNWSICWSSFCFIAVKVLEHTSSFDLQLPTVLLLKQSFQEILE